MVPAPSIQADEQPRGNAQPIGQFFHTDQLCCLRQEPLLRRPRHMKKMGKRRVNGDLPEADDSDDQREDPERRQGPIQHALGNALAGEEQAAAPV